MEQSDWQVCCVQNRLDSASNQKSLGSTVCRSEQALPPDAFGSLVHCLAAIGDDLWCALGSGSLVVYSLASREIRIKVLLPC